MLDYLISQKAIVQTNGRWTLQYDLQRSTFDIPESLRQMIRTQMERLSREDQRILAAASVAGVEFTAAAVAAGVTQEIIHTEEQCEDLVRRAYFLQAQGAAEWPDGTVTARYRFIHNLYRDALYESVPAGKRAYLHRRVGMCLEQGYGSQAREIAAELAVHFERGHDYSKAVQYLQQAAKNAIRR
jgi:predicted ATPase